MRLLSLIFTLGMAAAVAQAQLATPAPKPPTTPIPTPAPEPSLRGRLNFKAVGRGAPNGRVDAGSRGDGGEIASLYVLTPDEVGLTTRAQPSLFWYQTKPAKLPFELSILKPNTPTPVFRERRATAEVSGYQRFDLGAHGVHLEKDTDYQWVVALIRDPENRSRDIISSGWIRRVAAEQERGPSAAACAAQGLWYDAVTALFDQIAAHPGDAQLKADRRDLLAQVGLSQLTGAPTPAKKR